MRQRNKKIVLVEHSLPYPTLNHNFVQHSQNLIKMQAYSHESKHFGQLAQIFYEALVTQPINKVQPAQQKSHNASILVLKDRDTKRSSNFASTLEEKGIEESKFAKKVSSSQKCQIVVKRKSQSRKMDRKEESLLSYRSVSYSSQKKQPPNKHTSGQARCQSARKHHYCEKENSISDFTSSCSSKKAVKTIKYSILPARRMI